MALFITLLAAHVLADFVFQTQAIIKNKKKFWVTGLHVLIVAALTVILTGSLDPVLLGIIIVTHALLDLWKVHLSKGGLVSFLLDQAGHILAIYLVIILQPEAYENGFWPSGSGQALLSALYCDEALYLKLLTGLTGFILVTRAGGFLIDLMFREIALDFEPKNDGLVRGGMFIGYLERALVFFLVLTGQISTIGFLLAAKSFLRFGTVSGGAEQTPERAISEYVIIGTLASFGWALVLSYGTGTILRMI